MQPKSRIHRPFLTNWYRPIPANFLSRKRWYPLFPVVDTLFLTNFDHWKERRNRFRTRNGTQNINSDSDMQGSTTQTYKAALTIRHYQCPPVRRKHRRLPVLAYHPRYLPLPNLHMQGRHLRKRYKWESDKYLFFPNLPLKCKLHRPLRNMDLWIIPLHVHHSSSPPYNFRQPIPLRICLRNSGSQRFWNYGI